MEIATMKLSSKLLLVGTLGMAMQTAFADDVQVDPNNQARIRFFGQAVIGLEFYRNNICYGEGDSETASSTGFGGVFGSKKNISLGMPTTPNVTNIKERNGILAKAYFREYAISAGEPIAIHASYNESTGRRSWSCKDFGASFVPEKGQDYEVTLDLSQQSCQLNISKINVANGDVNLTPVVAKPAQEC